MSRPRVYITGEPWQLSIGGLVNDAATGETLGGATVQLTGPSDGEFARWLAIYKLQLGSSWDALRERPDRTQSSANGSFRFLNLPPAAAPYAVAVAATGHVAQSYSVTVPPLPAFAMVSAELAPLHASSSSSSSSSAAAPARPAKKVSGGAQR